MILSTQKNPLLNANINPRLNARINPRLNANINPKLNANINPKLNANINPRLNANINPRLNANINPKLNGNINPKLNSNINPRLNARINPNFISNYGGEIIFDMNLNPTEFLIKANGSVIQFFNLKLENTRFGVAHSRNGYCIFDNSGNFIGHLENDSANGYNEFDINNEWVSVVK
jgi:hypothetical protein